MQAQHPARSSMRDAAHACLVAFGMSVAWCLRGWSDLVAMRLPDTDDVVRLQQIRDWMAGQRFGDVTQYRLGPPEGLAMHWSRLGDIVPAAIIRLFVPLVGERGAELLAVTILPAATFAAALYLVARIARHVVPDRGVTTAIIVAALAFPATTLFMPGRIDHHGMQVVLLLGSVVSALAPPSFRRGAACGALAATSLVIGLETAPFFAVLGLAAAIDWIMATPQSARRLAGLGTGLLAGLTIGYGAFGGDGWYYAACDGFTAQAGKAAAILSLAPLALAACRLARRRDRIAAALLVGGAAAFGAFLQSPGCASPYGQVDPLLLRLWLSQVQEAQGLLHTAPGTALGYGGLVATGLIATLWQVRRRERSGWLLILALQATSLALTFIQLRGAYVGAILAAPALAAAIGAARASGSSRLTGAWLVSAGILYPLAASALPIMPATGGTRQNGCSSQALVDNLVGLPAGMVFAPIDVGAWGLARTPHNFAAAPYHRDNRGNLAMYRFFLQTPVAARHLAAKWHVDYVTACRSDLDAMNGSPESMARLLAGGEHPRWLRPSPARSRDMLLFEVVR